MSDEKETLEMVQANLNQELLCAHQELKKQSVVAQEYNHLKQQMAQAQTDLKFPHTKRVETMTQAHSNGQQLLDMHKKAHPSHTS